MRHIFNPGKADRTLLSTRQAHSCLFSKPATPFETMTRYFSFSTQASRSNLLPDKSHSSIVQYVCPLASTMLEHDPCHADRSTNQLI